MGFFATCVKIMFFLQHSLEYCFYVLMFYLQFDESFCFCNFLKNEIGNSEKNTPKCGRFHSPPGAILLSFCNFPYTLGTLGCMENCKNSVKLHQVGSGSGHVISILKPGFDNIAFSLNITVVMHPNGPRCIRNE